MPDMLENRRRRLTAAERQEKAAQRAARLASGDGGLGRGSPFKKLMASRVNLTNPRTTLSLMRRRKAAGKGSAGS